jgi:hypothetical protein
MAAQPRNYLIHVYESRDDLSPFLYPGRFHEIRDKIKEAIWDSMEKHGVDVDLSVDQWVFTSSTW